MSWMLLLGVAAGALTTISGFGGGFMLVLALAVAIGIKQALAVSALALLVGNAHRLWLYRGALAWNVARPLLIGVIPGSLLGALFMVGVPTWLVHALMTGVVLLSLARAYWGFAFVLPPRAMTASGFAIGVLTGTAGGAALLMGPLLLAAGLSGHRYLATMALASVGMHAFRLVGYGAGGLYDAAMVAHAAGLAVALIVGNLIGDAVRVRLGSRVLRGLELATPVVALGLALSGAA
jgi:uncharacterized protein